MSTASPNANQRKTFIIHLIFSIIEGIIAGVILMNEFVFVKSLNGSTAMLATLFQATTIILLFGIILTEILKRVRNKRRFLFITAILTRTPLLLFAFFSNSALNADSELYHLLFIVIFFVYFMANPVIFPIINQFLKGNYSHDNFGRYFSYATSVKKIFALVAAFLFGIWLDHDKFAFTTLYPIIGVLGIGSIMLLSFIPYQDEELTDTGNFIQVIRKSIKSMVTVLKADKPFRNFELGFMLYGFAFMSTVAAVTKFQDEILQMNYTSVGFYKSYYNIIAIILLPFCGRAISKITPERFARYTYISLFFYLFFLASAEFFPCEWQIQFDDKSLQIFPLVLLAFTAFGVFTATMALLWGIGSAYFCPKDQAGTYQSIHITLTGFRATFIPHIGILLLILFNYRGVFITAMLSLLIAVGFLYFSEKRRLAAK